MNAVERAAANRALIDGIKWAQDLLDELQEAQVELFLNVAEPHVLTAVEDFRTVSGRAA